MDNNFDERTIEIIGTSLDGQEMRPLMIRYNVESDEFDISILSSTAKTLASTRLGRKGLIQSTKLLNASKGRRRNRFNLS